MKIKSAPLQVKAAGEDDGLEDGQFIAYASVFGGPPDSYGDIVDKGAFEDTLDAWKESGDPIPLLWGHDFFDPFSNIGHIVEAAEDDHGLRVKGEFDLENDKARQVYRLVKGRRTTDLSFAYNIVDAEEKDDGYHLKQLEVLEISIVPIGANRFTDVVAVKHLADGINGGLKAGRKLSASNEQALREAYNLIGDVLSTVDDGGEDDTGNDEGSASDNGDASKSSASRHDRPVEDSEAKSVSSVELRAFEIQLAQLQG